MITLIEKFVNYSIIFKWSLIHSVLFVFLGLEQLIFMNSLHYGSTFSNGNSVLTGSI